MHVFIMVSMASIVFFIHHYCHRNCIMSWCMLYLIYTRCCRRGQAPIQLACKEGHASCIEFLAAHGADVNVVDE